MKLTKVSIRHFKSLSEVDVQLHPQVTVLVGPNAVGKSNFVDALRFMRDVTKTGLDEAISRRDGLSRILPHHAKPETSVELRAHMASAESTHSPDWNYFQITTPAPSREQVVTHTDYELTDELLPSIRKWKFSVLNVQNLRTLSTEDTDEPLREDGFNWASVIRTAKRSAKGRRMLERITEMMQYVLPDFQSVSVISAGSYLVPQFKFGKDKSNTRTFDPVQLSDGTLRIFGILLSLYQSPAPTLIVIEEPELSVHPSVLAMLAEAFKEVSEITQIIVTSHSPQLIDHFAPENIRIVTMTDGLTHIGPIKRAQQEAVQEGLMGLGEFMAAEGLQPELQ